MAVPLGLAGLAFGVLSALCQGIGIVLTKDAIGAVGVVPASMVRLAAGAAGLVLIETTRGRHRGLLREVLQGMLRQRLLVASVAGTFVGFWFFQLSILLASPPVTAALVGTAPLFATPLASRLLGERLHWTALLGTSIAVGGVALVVLG